ncbi:MAG TPA: PilN domain-containing protein [Solirubrobacterales bacterium]|jgi:Tfp pilus assembly protein PilN
MRPIDLIPAELRQGAHGPMRTGAIPYIVVGALVAILAGVALMVSTSNQISERRSEVAHLKREDAAAKQQATRLSAYVQFQTLHEQRVATITSLADSRFDWERVMRELSLILPQDVWLTDLNASAAAGSGSGGGESAGSGGVAGPSLELSGCATGQESVASFVTALKDIDGVTRVGLQSSELSAQELGAGGSEGGGGQCQTRSFIAKFQLVVAFDAAPLPITAVEGEVPVAAPEAAEATSSEAESSESEGSEGG